MRSRDLALRLLSFWAMLVLPIAPAASARDVKLDAAGVHAIDAWIRWLPGGLPLAGYMTLVNSATTAVTLVRVGSSDFDSVMLHVSYTTADDQVRMKSVDRLSIPAHGKIKFAPGGFHLMLMHPKSPLNPGSSISLDLLFSDGSHLRVPAVIRPAAYE